MFLDASYYSRYICEAHWSVVRCESFSVHVEFIIDIIFIVVILHANKLCTLFSLAFSVVVVPRQIR